MFLPMSEPCEIMKCQSGLPGTVMVNDNVGDGSWNTLICRQCAAKLGLSDGDDLPDSQTVERLINAIT